MCPTIKEWTRFFVSMIWMQSLNTYVSGKKRRRPDSEKTSILFVLYKVLLRVDQSYLSKYPPSSLFNTDMKKYSTIQKKTHKQTINHTFEMSFVHTASHNIFGINMMMYITTNWKKCLNVYVQYIYIYINPTKSDTYL